MRLMMCVAAMPRVVALSIAPIGEQPEFLRLFEGTEHFHSDESRHAIHQVWSPHEGLLDRVGHAVGDRKCA